MPAPPRRSWCSARGSRGTAFRFAAVAALGAIATPLAASTLPPPVAVRFVREHVRLTIEDRRLMVDGRYVFTIPDSAGLAVDYPFPSDSGLGDPVLVGVTATADRHPARVHARWLGTSAVRLRVGDRGDSCAINVTYRQPLLARRAVYLLTTARAWGRPMDSAVLEVDLPDSLGTPRFSMPFEPIAREAGRTLFRFAAAPFWPDKDLVVSW